MGKPLLLWGLLVSVSGCIGTDVLDGPEIEERLEIAPDRIAVLIGNSINAKATFYNSVGSVQQVGIDWSIEPSSIATVDQTGKVTGIAKGQGKLTANYMGLTDEINVTVVEDENSVAVVDISAVRTTLSIGEGEALTLVVKNINNQVVTGSTITWHSSDMEVLTIDTDGTAVAQANGTAVVTAEVDGIHSNELTFTVAGQKIGTFVQAGGYAAMGMATLKIENNELILELSSDFETDFALGTFIYLSNTISSGNAVRSTGIEISEIKENGSHLFNVSEKFPDLTISEYSYVIILCKPAGVIFGYAELNE